MKTKILRGAVAAVTAFFIVSCLALFPACGGGKTGTCADGHTVSNWETVDASCTEDGYRYGVCDVCGQEVTEKTVDALGHNFEEDPGSEKNVPATCESEGVRALKCLRCDATSTEIIPKLSETGEHTWDEGTVTKAPACETEGEIVYACTVCGATYTEPVPASGHSWDEGEVTTNPTCEDAGETTYTCLACGETRTESVAPTGHTWDDGEVTTEPACTADGEMTYTCSVCGVSYTEAIPETGHKWNEGAVTKEPTCGAEGEMTYTCSSCGETYVEEIPATGDHIWDDGEITAEPTCVDEGEIAYTCTVCGDTYTDSVPATGEHSYVGAVTKEPTCTEEGETTYTCSVCGETYAEPIAATGHSWDEGKVTLKATCETEGEMTYTCSECGETETKTISKLSDTGEHTWDEGTITENPTCGADGEMTYTCKVCNETKTEIVPATGEHVWDGGTVTKAPTAEEEGETLYTCEVCGATYTEAIDKLPVPVGVSLSTDNLELEVGETATLVATVTMSDGSEYEGEYEWTSSEDPVARVSGDGAEGTVVAVSKGSATITVTAGDCSASCAVTVTDSSDMLIYSENTDGTYTVTGVKDEYKGTIAKVVIPDEHEGVAVTAIKANAFKDCTSVESVSIGKNVASIGDSAFEGCTGITEIYYNAACAADLAIYSSVFYKAGKEGEGITVTFGSDVESVPKYLFYSSSSDVDNAPNIVTVIFEDGSVCVSIGDYAFQNCTHLEIIAISDSVTSIGTYAFYGCTSLESVVIPDSVTSIGAYAFSGCSSMTSLTIGEGVTDIGNYAFQNSTALTEIRFNAANMGKLSSGNNVFYNAGVSGDGIAVTIGSGVESIPNYLFYPASGLSDCKIVSLEFEEESKCESIGAYAFYGCTSLKSIVIAESVASIGEYAFSDCTAVTEIRFDAVNMNDLSDVNGNYVFRNVGQRGSGITLVVGANVERIPAYLFSTSGAYIPNIVSVIFEEGSVCSEIGEYAFYRCTSLRSVVLPASILKIGTYAFDDCSLLSAVYYCGTSEEWDAVQIGIYNSYLTGAQIYFYSEEEPNFEDGNSYWYRDKDGSIAVWTKEDGD